jgi:hypothetical protein
MSDKRLQDLDSFYSILNALKTRIGGARTLAGCRGRMRWPARGVYFFHETGENRSDTGEGQRVVRVGTHALKEGGSTTLWSRLSAHRGQLRSGGGNHRGSIFRLIVGTALIGRDGPAERWNTHLHVRRREPPPERGWQHHVCVRRGWAASR